MAPFVVRAATGIAGFFVLLGGSSVAAAAAPTGAPDFAAIDSYVSQSLAGTPGYALAVVQGTQVEHVKGFGLAGDNSPVTSDTPFIIGSESKSFTALGVMQLSESGALNLDASVQSYLPWFRVADAGFSREITVRQLLNQSSGLPASAPFETPVTSVESRVRDLASVNLVAAPGRVFTYSNSNYDALGLIIEAVSGQPYATYMQQHIFSPLNMTHTYASESEARADGLAPGHEFWFGAPISTGFYRSDLIPAGFIVSTASDMSHYLIAQLNGGNYAGAQVISAAGIAEMHRGVVPDSGGTYGMGWLNATVSGAPVVEHDGDALSFRSDMILVPGSGWGIELIANASSLTENLPDPVDATAKGVVSMLMGSTPPFTPSPLDTYIAFDLVFVAAVGFQVWSVVRALRNRVEPAQPGVASVLRRMVAPVAWRAVLAVAMSGVVFVILGGLVGASPLLVAETDLGQAVIVVSMLLVANAAMRAAQSYRSMRLSGRVALHSVPTAQLQEAAS